MPPRAAIVTMGTPSSRRLRLNRRCTSRGSLRPAGPVTRRKPGTWRLAAAAGHRDAPTCTDCHSEHKIEGLTTSSSLKISVEVCSKCHASERMNTKYNLPPDRAKTFFESYHGLA